MSRQLCNGLIQIIAQKHVEVNRSVTLGVKIMNNFQKNPQKSYIVAGIWWNWFDLNGSDITTTDIFMAILAMDTQ